MATTPILDVTDTAAWVATYRARETLRNDALFQDPLASVLAGDWGSNIADKNQTFGAEWYIVIRTVIIDKFIQDVIAEGVDTVVNLGAGLDTRPYRLDLPKELLWIEVDYPRIIDLKTKKLEQHSAVCRLERVALDLADVALRQDLLSSINSRGKKILVLTEGVLPYLSVEQVATLADDLRAQSHFQYWIVDYFAKSFMKLMTQGKRKKQMQNAPFLFNPNNWLGFFIQHRWQLKTMKYMIPTSRELGRSPPYPSPMHQFIKLVPKFILSKVESLSGFGLLEIKN